VQPQFPITALNRSTLAVLLLYLMKSLQVCCEFIYPPVTYLSSVLYLVLLRWDNSAGQTHQRTFCGSVEEPIHLVALPMPFEDRRSNGE
jgi:hypothetical protein